MSMSGDELYRKWERKQTEQSATRRQSENWRKSVENGLPKSLQLIDKNHTWEGPAPISGSTGRESVDVKGNPLRKNDRVVYIELEAARTTCVRNVVKIWMIMAKNPTANSCLIIHVFSPFFIKKERGKLESVFIGEQAQQNTNKKLEYKYIELSDWLSADILAEKIIPEF